MLLLFFLNGNSAYRATAGYRLAVAISAVLRDNMRFAVFHPENFGAERLAGAAADAEILIDFWFAHISF